MDTDMSVTYRLGILWGPIFKLDFLTKVWYFYGKISYVLMPTILL